MSNISTVTPSKRVVSEKFSKVPSSQVVHPEQFIRAYHHLYRFGLNFQCLNLYALMLHYSNDGLLSHARQKVLCDTLGLSRKQLYRNMQKLKGPMEHIVVGPFDAVQHQTV